MFALSVEVNLAISVLKLSKEGSVLIEDVKKDARLPSSVTCKLLKKMQNQGLIYLRDEVIEADSNRRVKLAINAVSLGADVQNISNLLRWQEFEEITALVLRNNGYEVQKNVRFKVGQRRREIDVVGCRRPLVLCFDCKHWGKAVSPSSLRKIVDAQIDRTMAFADSFPNAKLNFPCVLWEKAKFIPIVLLLMPNAYKYCHEVPIVPVLKLQEFVLQLPVYTHEVKFFSKKFQSLC